MSTRLVLAMVFAIMCAWVLPVFAATHSIQGVNVSNLPDSVQITVKGSGALAVHPTRVGDRYIAFDVYGRLAKSEQKKVDIGDGGIKTVKCGWFRSTPPIARIVVATTGWKEYSVSQQDGKRLTTIKIAKIAAKPDDETEVPIVGKPVLVASTSPVAVAPSSKPKLVSLDFVASDIHDILKALAMQSGINIVASPNVTGNVTVSLNNVTIEEALKLVTNLSGFKFAKVDGAYVVGTSENLRALAVGASSDEQKVTEVAIVKYSDPALINKMLESQFGMVQVTSTISKDGKGGSNVFILTGNLEDVAAAKEMIDGVENSLVGSVESTVTELYEVKYGNIEDLSNLVTASIPGLKVSLGPNQGFMLKRPGGVATGSDSTGGTSQGDVVAKEQVEPAKFLVLQGTQDAVDKAKAFLTQLDIQRPQITIEAKVLDISDTGSKDLGLDWGGEFGVLSTFRLGEVQTPGNQATTVERMARSPLGVDARIKALVEDGKAKVLANPNVMALDGKPASIFIGDELIYVTRIDEGSEGVTVTTETARVGIQLHSISTVSSDGFITMDLHPEVSVLTGWKEIPRTELAFPEISRRFVDSTVRVKDGETIVIGGLIRDDEIVTMSGIPFLKDLPFIGALFRSKSTSKAHSEVVMMITPRIISSI